MNKTYRTKRDQYKTEAESSKREAEMWKKTAQEKQKKLDEKAAEAKKRYSATVYCTNCLHVNDVSIPPGVRIDAGDCVTCRVIGMQKVVISYPGKI